MAFLRVVMCVGLLATALVVGVAGETPAAETCAYGSASGKQDCTKSLEKDQKLTITCPSGATWSPSGIFEAKTNNVCKVAYTDLNATCSEQNTAAFNTLVPGGMASASTDSRTIYNTVDLAADVTVYGKCVSSANGYTIAVTFKKTAASAAAGGMGSSSIAAILLGLASLLVVAKA